MSSWLTSLLVCDKMKVAKLVAVFAFLQLYWSVTAVIGDTKAKCQRIRTESFRSKTMYIPKCNPDGTFKKQQCNYTLSLVQCWQVDKQGRRTGVPDQFFPLRGKPSFRPTKEPEITTMGTRSTFRLTNEAHGTRTMVYTIPNIYGNEVVEGKKSIKTEIPREQRLPTRCEKLRTRRENKKRKATVIPQCTKDGHFKREQCTVGRKKCWCVNENGRKIPGTKVHNGKPKCYPEVCGKRFEKPPSRLRRVVGGREATPNTWPWQALVLFSDPKHICGGTLVKRNWLVTAASCFDGFPERTAEWSVRLGAHRLKAGKHTPDRISVEAIHIHPKYKRGTKTHPGDYDVALVQVSSSASIPSNTWPLCLPEDISFYQSGTRCTITGWGHTSYNGTRATALREAWVDLVPLDECNSNKSYNGIINDRFMCAGFKEGGVDACHFDTGGPLACPVKGGVWALAGIISWRQKCAEPHKYGVYTNVHVIKPWIEQTIGRH